jgi:YVTN family beta-propeller protein
MCRTLALISVVAAPDGKSIYVTTGRGQGVVIIDTATNKPVASIEVGGRHCQRSFE